MDATFTSFLMARRSRIIGSRLNRLPFSDLLGLGTPMGEYKGCFEKRLQDRRVGYRVDSFLFTQDVGAAEQDLADAEMEELEVQDRCEAVTEELLLAAQCRMVEEGSQIQEVGEDVDLTVD